MEKIKDLIIDIKWIFKGFFGKIEKMVDYFPIIWDDEDWDFDYTLKVLAFKLQRQINYMSKTQRFVGWEDTVKEMQTALNIINNLSMNFNSNGFSYDTEYLDYYTCNWNISKGVFERELIEDNLDEFFKKYPNEYKKVLKEVGENKDRADIAHIMSSNISSKARRILFEFLNHNHQKWWD